MELHERRVGDVIVLDIRGKLTLMNGIERLKDTINNVLHEGACRVALNLRDVSYIDSAGLGQLIASFTAVTSHGGTLKLFNVGHRSKDLLAITKLLTVFDTYEDEQETLRSFSREEGDCRNLLPSAA